MLLRIEEIDLHSIVSTDLSYMKVQVSRFSILGNARCTLFMHMLWKQEGARGVLNALKADESIGRNMYLSRKQ